jgi:hypothetical protein
MVLGVAGCIINLSASEMDEWWRSRVVRQTFAQAANTKIVAEFDFGMRLHTLSPELSEAYDPVDLLPKSARANGLFTRGLLGLIVASGGLDPLTGHPLNQYDQLALRWISPNGEIRKLMADDDIAGVVVISESTAKMLKKGARISDFSHGAASIVTQGLDATTFKRSAEFTRNLFGVR